MFVRTVIYDRFWLSHVAQLKGFLLTKTDNFPHARSLWKHVTITWSWTATLTLAHWTWRHYTQRTIRTDWQWRGCVVYYVGGGGGGQSGKTIKLFQIIPYVIDFQIFNNPGPWQPCMHLEKKLLVLPFMSFILDDVKLAVIHQQFWMKELTFSGVETYSDLSYIIFIGSRSRYLNRQDLRAPLIKKLRIWLYHM